MLWVEFNLDRLRRAGGLPPSARAKTSDVHGIARHTRDRVLTGQKCFRSTCIVPLGWNCKKNTLKRGLQTPVVILARGPPSRSGRDTWPDGSKAMSALADARSASALQTMECAGVVAVSYGWNPVPTAKLGIDCRNCPASGANDSGERGKSPRCGCCFSPVASAFVCHPECDNAGVARLHLRQVRC